MDILAPIARAILCLESPDSTLADVMMYWSAICAWYRRLLNDPTIDLGAPTREALVSIINRRYREIINNGPHDAYMACLALDPRKFSTDISPPIPNDFNGKDIFAPIYSVNV